MSSEIRDHLHAPFYEAAAQGRIVLPCCSSCEKWHWYPQWVCPHCQSRDWEWTDVPGGARLVAWTTVQHQFAEDFAPSLPFTIVLVEFDGVSGVRFITNLRGEDHLFVNGRLRIGSPLEFVFESPVGSSSVLPVARLVADDPRADPAHPPES